MFLLFVLLVWCPGMFLPTRRAAAGSGIALVAHMALSKRARRQVSKIAACSLPKHRKKCVQKTATLYPMPGITLRSLIKRKPRPSAFRLEGGSRLDGPQPFANCLTRLRRFFHHELTDTLPKPLQAGLMMHGGILAALAGTATVCAGLAYLKPGEAADCDPACADANQYQPTGIQETPNESSGVSNRPREEERGGSLSRVRKYRSGLRRLLTALSPNTRNLVRLYGLYFLLYESRYHPW